MSKDLMWTYFTETTSVRIFDDESFCIIGDDSEVSDSQIADMFQAKPVAGWDTLST